MREYLLNLFVSLRGLEEKKFFSETESYHSEFMPQGASLVLEKTSKPFLYYMFFHGKG